MADSASTTSVSLPPGRSSAVNAGAPCPRVVSTGATSPRLRSGPAQDGRWVGGAIKCLTDDGGEVIFAADAGRVPPGTAVSDSRAFPPKDHHHHHDRRVRRVLAVGGLVVQALAHHPDAQRLAIVSDHHHDRRLQRSQAEPRQRRRSRRFRLQPNQTVRPCWSPQYLHRSAINSTRPRPRPVSDSGSSGAGSGTLADPLSLTPINSEMPLRQIVIRNWPPSPVDLCSRALVASSLTRSKASLVTGHGPSTCACRQPRPHHATRRYSLIRPPT